MNDSSVPVMEPGVSKSKGNRKFIWVIVGILAFMLLLLVAAIVLFRSSVGVHFIPSEGMIPTLQSNDHITTNKLIYRTQEPALGDVIVFNTPPAAGMGGKLFVKRVIGIPGDRIRVRGRYIQIGDQRYYSDDITASIEPFLSRRVQFTENAVIVDKKRLSKEQIIEMVDESAGAKVVIIPGVVYRNGKALSESYVWEDPDNDYPSKATPSELLVTDKDGNLEVKVPEGKLLVMGDNRNNSNDGRVWGMLDRKSVVGKVTAIVSPQERAGPVK